LRLAKAEGVAEVASVGGFVKQYRSWSIRALRALASRCRRSCARRPASNMDTGGRTVELSEFEFMVRGRGYLKSVADIENIVLKSRERRARCCCATSRGRDRPDERRGITELNGEGEVASGIVLQRYGANALS
jgi:Cu(I)/Ag(I) efflux system membrane protein CusA/SilA